MVAYASRARWISRHSPSFRLRPGISATTTVNEPIWTRSSRLPPGRSPRSSRDDREMPSPRIADHLREDGGGQEQDDVQDERERERARVREGPVQQPEEEEPAQRDADGPGHLLRGDE